MRNPAGHTISILVLLAAWLTSEAHAQAASPRRPPETRPQTQPADWTEKDALPLLVATMIQPVAERDQFKIDSLYIEYLHEGKPLAPARSSASEAEAIAVARKWVVVHFGDSPADVTLQMKGVDRSPGEPVRPFDASQADHTVEFRQVYRGIATSSRVVFSATGQTPSRVIIELCRYEPVPDSAKVVVSKDAAIKAWRAIFEARATPEKLAEFDKAVKELKPELRYLWSPLANRGLAERRVYAPTWVLDSEGSGLFMVDGHSGKAWYND